MKAIVLEQPGRFQITEAPEPPALKSGEARVRVRRVGICGTDLHAYRGQQPFFSYPRILGHELGVELIEIGPDVRGLAVGDHCAVEPYLDCGSCLACRRGKPNCCMKLRVLGVHTDGGLRESIVVPAEKLHRSTVLSLDQLALVETLGIGAHAVERAGLERGECVLVIGAGPIGLSVIPFARQAGARVIVMDLNESRLDFCRRHLDVEHVLSAEVDPIERVQSLLDGDLPTAVFDATGSATSMCKAFDFVAHGGRIVFVGLVQADITFHDPSFHRRELTLLATRNSTAATFRRIIQLVEEGRIDTTPWISHRAPFGEMIEQFPDWLDPAGGVIKAMVEM
jgi:2-desacetyl-2-hydroxyethyl bacteriochlorophyllide A dehydrogenase